MRIIASILLFILAQGSVFAQELPTKVERDQMLIGEVNTIIIQHGGTLQQSDLLDFKLLKAKTSQTTETSEPIEMEVYSLEYSPQEIKIQFTLWDSAQVVVPPFSLNKSGGFTSQAFMFQVNFPQVDENGDIVDIHEMTIEVSALSELSKNLWWLIDLFLLAVFVLGLLLVLHVKKSAEKVGPIIQMSAEERALSDLEKLMQRKLFYEEEQKLHFAEFSDILRRYIGLRYNFITFEKTSSEIVEHLQKLRLENEIIEEFDVLLQVSDMIKFSKATTDESDIKRSYQSASALIARTSKFHNSEQKGAPNA